MAKKFLNLIDGVFSTNLIERLNIGFLCGNYNGGSGGDGGGCSSWTQDAYVETILSLQTLLQARGKDIIFWMDASVYEGTEGDALVESPVRVGLASTGSAVWHTNGENGVPYITTSNMGLRSTWSRPRTVVNVLETSGTSNIQLPGGRHAVTYGYPNLVSFINLGRPPLSVDYTWGDFSIVVATDYLVSTTLYYDILSYQNGVTLYNSGSSAYNNPSENGGTAVGNWYESIVINDVLTPEEDSLLKSYFENKYCSSLAVS